MFDQAFVDILPADVTTPVWLGLASKRTSLISIPSVFDQAFVDILTADVITPVWLGLAEPI